MIDIKSEKEEMQAVSTDKELDLDAKQLQALLIASSMALRGGQQRGKIGHLKSRIVFTRESSSMQYINIAHKW